MKRNKDIISKIINVSTTSFPEAEVYLFGSRTKQKSIDESDWDLLILLNSVELNIETEIRILDEFYNLELETGEIFTPIIYTKEYWQSNQNNKPFFQNIRNDVKRLI